MVLRIPFQELHFEEIELYEEFVFCVLDFVRHCRECDADRVVGACHGAF